MCRIGLMTSFLFRCIVSSPLVLGLDLLNKTNVDKIWPIISNTEAIAVNQAWAGDSGTLVKQSVETVHLPNCPHTGCPPTCRPPAPQDPTCLWPTWMIFKKNLPASKTAIYLVNNDNKAAAVSIQWSEVAGLHCPAAGCRVRDVHSHTDLGLMRAGFSKVLLVHDSAFIVVSA